MPSRREFMTVLGGTLAGALAVEWSVGAPAVGPQGRHPRRGEWPTLNVSTGMQAFGLPNMTPNAPHVNATAILNEAISLAAPNRFTNLIADPGTYYFPLQANPSPPPNYQYVV